MHAYPAVGGLQTTLTDVLRMMEVSRHKRVETVQGYVRRANGFKGHAGKDFL